jgi:hypothetical protein
LLEARNPFLGCSFSNGVFVDGPNVSGRLCNFGASIELVKKKVSEMFIFLNLTLHSFDPENFVPLVKIGEFQNDFIEKNESYKMVYTMGTSYLMQTTLQIRRPVYICLNFSPAYEYPKHDENKM